MQRLRLERLGLLHDGVAEYALRYDVQNLKLIKKLHRFITANNFIICVQRPSFGSKIVVIVDKVRGCCSEVISVIFVKIEPHYSGH